MKRRELDTEDLVDDLWGQMIPAWIGSSVALIAAFSTGLTFLALDRVPWPIILLNVAAILVGIGLTIPWVLTEHELHWRRVEKRARKYAKRNPHPASANPPDK